MELRIELSSEAGTGLENVEMELSRKSRVFVGNERIGKVT